MMRFTYMPKGVCSKQFIFDIEDGIIKDLQIIGGCAGNTVGVANLAKGCMVDDVIVRLQGIPCGFRGTSCLDQLAKALQEWKKQNEA